MQLMERNAMAKRPLTEAEKAVAEEWWPTALRLGEIMAWQYYAHRCGVEPSDIATEGLTKAVKATLRPGHPFGALLARCVRLVAIDLIRTATDWRKVWRRGKDKAPSTIQLDTEAAAAALLLDEHPIGWEIESEDEVRRFSRGLTPKEGEVVRRLYLDASIMTMKQAGKAMGVCESRVSQLHHDAIMLMRDRGQRDRRA